MKNGYPKLLALAEAGEAGEPSQHRLRHAMHNLMPAVYSLRNAGFSMGQIKSLLASAGIELSELEINTFYNDWQIKKLHEGIWRLQKQVGVEDLEIILPPEPSPSVAPKENASGAWRCLPLKAGIKQLDHRPEVQTKTPEAYEVGQLEHPAIHGLTLSLEERLYGLCLEMENEHGETRVESVQEKGFRIRWRKPVPMTEYSTSKSFVKMNMELFKPDGKI